MSVSAPNYIFVLETGQFFVGEGSLCTKTLLHEGSILPRRSVLHKWQCCKGVKKVNICNIKKIKQIN